MWLKKETGGTSVTQEGREYCWPDDGSVCEVPVALGEELLSIRGAGFTEAAPPAKPAPKAAAAKTAEPAKT